MSGALSITRTVPQAPAAATELIPGVPRTITREQYLGMMSAVGLNPDRLQSLEFRPDGIYAVALATDTDGRRLVDGDHLATHRVYVQVTP